MKHQLKDYLVHLINRLRFLFLFIILFLFFIFKAITAQLGWHIASSGIIFGVIIASTLLIIGHKEKLVITLLTAMIIIPLLLNLLGHYATQNSLVACKMLFIVLFFLLMLIFCLYFTAQDETISITTLFGSISSYLFMGLIFAYLYLFIELISPRSFSTFNKNDEIQAIYFSFITLTTVGYGEIVPLKPVAQMCVWFEAFCGQIYLAISVGQLVGRYVTEQKK